MRHGGQASSAVALRFLRRSGDDWVPAGSIAIHQGQVVGGEPAGLDERLVRQALLALYLDNVTFGAVTVDGIPYRWEEVKAQQDEDVERSLRRLRESLGEVRLRGQGIKYIVKVIHPVVGDRGGPAYYTEPGGFQGTEEDATRFDGYLEAIIQMVEALHSQGVLAEPTEIHVLPSPESLRAYWAQREWTIEECLKREA
jgi:hypothetical protein